MKMTEDREIASSWTTKLCPVMKKKLDANIQDSRTKSLMRSNDFVFEMHYSDTNPYLVDLSRHFCSCNY